MKEPFVKKAGDLSIVTISDIHYGKKPNAEHLYRELYEEFIKWCLVHRPDIVVLDGDLTDRRLQMNSEAATYCNKFMHDLYELSKLGMTVLVVHGTLSHENFQILSYGHYIGENFRMYTKACVDYVKGLKLLILPEEYVADADAYYRDLLNVTEPYDFAFGHGMFKHAGGYTADGDDNTKKHAVTWLEEQFRNIVRGYVVFGHIHTSIIKGNVIYNGSFSRLNHGEEEDKGFYAFLFNTVSGKKSKVFIKNTMAPVYNSYYIVWDQPNKIAWIDKPGIAPDFKRERVFESITGFTEEDIVDPIMAFIKKASKEDDFIRIIPEMNSDVNLYHLLLAFSREISNITLNNKHVVRNIAVAEIKEESEQEKQDRLKREKYKGLHFLEVTKKYAFEEYGEVLNDDTILAAIKPL